MQFKQFLKELANIETGQAIEAHEPTEENSSSVINPSVFAEVNHRLIVELNDTILSPEQGIQKIRKVLHRYAMDMPALYDADPMGDEMVFELNQFGAVHGVQQNGTIVTGQNVVNTNPDAYLYFIYYLEDNGRYEFHAEMVAEEGLEEIISDDDDDEDVDEIR
jgi:hypothetical protein